jgi:endonuclease III
LREITGFGPKLSSMVPINLIRNLGMHLSDQDTMDIAVDGHVERVLKRTGLCHQDADYAEMALTARKIADQEGRFAMELDLPLWATGKFFCHEYNCGDCPLNNVCSKIFDKKMIISQKLISRKNSQK